MSGPCRGSQPVHQGLQQPEVFIINTSSWRSLSPTPREHIGPRCSTPAAPAAAGFHHLHRESVAHRGVHLAPHQLEVSYLQTAGDARLAAPPSHPPARGVHRARGGGATGTASTATGSPLQREVGSAAQDSGGASIHGLAQLRSVTPPHHHVSPTTSLTADKWEGMCANITSLALAPQPGVHGSWQHPR